MTPNHNNNPIPPDTLVANFRIDFKNQLSEEILNLLVDFFDSQQEFELNPQEYGNSTNDKGHELCTLLAKKGFINSIENIKTKFRDLLAKVNEDDRFDGLSFLYQWLEQWIAKPGFKWKNQSKLSANVESKLFILMEKDLKKVKEVNKFIIHPLCTDQINEKIGDKLVSERVLEFLNQSKKKVLLILGNAGSGKSTCCQMILRLLWARYNSTEIGKGEIPLNASISDKNEQAWLKTNRTIHFILDAYDELYSQDHLFSQTDLDKFDGKIIISCRNESLPDLKLLSPPNSEIMKIYLTPWTEQQISEYLTNSTTDDRNNFGKFDKFQKLIESIPSLKEFIQTPFHLKIITEILPQISGKLNDNRTVNRYEIYDLFIRNRINQAILNRGPLQHLETMNLTSEQLPDAVIQQCIEWSIQMRNEKSTTLSFNLKKSKIVPQFQSLSKMNGPEQILKWLSPLLIEEDGDIVNCRFIHATIGEFFLVFQLNQILTETKSTPENHLNEIKNHPIFSELLGISTWQFISDLTKFNEKLKEQIWNLIEFSKESEEFSIVAANCASIWNICGFSFSRKDLRNIKIPGAFLNLANFYGTDLRNANLTRCTLKDAILSGANLEQANMKHVYFGETQSWKFDYPLQKSVIFGTQLITHSANGLEMWNLVSRERDHLLSEAKEEKFFDVALFNKLSILVVLSEANIQFWDLKTTKCVFTLTGNYEKVAVNETRSELAAWRRDKLTLFVLKSSPSVQSPSECYSVFHNVDRFHVIDTVSEKHVFSNKMTLASCFSKSHPNIVYFVTQATIEELTLPSHQSKVFEFPDDFRFSSYPLQVLKSGNEIIFGAGVELIFFDCHSFEIDSRLSFAENLVLLFLCEVQNLVLTFSSDSLFSLIDIKSRKKIASMAWHSRFERILSLTTSKNGFDLLLLENTNTLRFLNWKTKLASSITATSLFRIERLVLSDNSHELIIVHRDFIRFWDVAKNQLISKIEFQFDPSQTWIFQQNIFQYFNNDKRKGIHVWITMSADVHEIVLSPQYIIVYLKSNEVQILHFDGTFQVSFSQNLPFQIIGVSISSVYIITKSKDHRVKMLPLANRNGLAITFGGKKKTESITYLSENGKYLVLTSLTGLIQIWKLESQKLKATLYVSYDVTSISASKDFSQLFVGTGNGSVWNFKLSPKIELTWVMGPTIMAKKANLNGTNISPENRKFLEQNGALKNDNQ